MTLPPFVHAEQSDVERFSRMTPEGHLAIFLELCDLTDSIIAGRPDPETLRARTPRSKESDALWQRLMERRRGAR